MELFSFIKQTLKAIFNLLRFVEYIKKIAATLRDVYNAIEEKAGKAVASLAVGIVVLSVSLVAIIVIVILNPMLSPQDTAKKITFVAFAPDSVGGKFWEELKKDIGSDVEVVSRDSPKYILEELRGGSLSKGDIYVFNVDVVDSIIENNSVYYLAQLREVSPSLGIVCYSKVLSLSSHLFTSCNNEQELRTAIKVMLNERKTSKP